jgi:hypothetical protein
MPVTEGGEPFGVTIRIIYRAWAVADILHALCGRKSGIREPCYGVVGAERKGKIGIIDRTRAGD